MYPVNTNYSFLLVLALSITLLADTPIVKLEQHSPSESVFCLALSYSAPHTSISIRGQTMPRPCLGRCRAPKTFRKEEEECVLQIFSLHKFQHINANILFLFYFHPGDNHALSFGNTVTIIWDVKRYNFVMESVNQFFQPIFVYILANQHHLKNARVVITKISKKLGRCVKPK